MIYILLNATVQLNYSHDICSSTNWYIPFMLLNFSSFKCAKSISILNFFSISKKRYIKSRAKNPNFLPVNGSSKFYVLQLNISINLVLIRLQSALLKQLKIGL